MANWVIRCAEEYFYPVTEYLRKKLLLRDIVHVDETPVQVLKEEGKSRRANHTCGFTEQEMMAGSQSSCTTTGLQGAVKMQPIT